MTNKLYFISIIEEFWPGQIVKYMGRVEVYALDKEYAIDEIRFGTNKEDEWWEFREKYDFCNVNHQELNQIKKNIKENFYEVTE